MVAVFFRTSSGLSVFSVSFFDVVDKGCHLGLSSAVFFFVICGVFFCHLKVEALPPSSEKLSSQGSHMAHQEIPSVVIPPGDTVGKVVISR